MSVAQKSSTPAKNVLADSTDSSRNIQQQKDSPLSAGKKRRHDGSPISSQQQEPSSQQQGPSSQRLQLAPKRYHNGRLPNAGSQQDKSKFEQDLEQLSQGISDRKKNGHAETDQQWPRPDLPVGFDPKTHKLSFQQIEAEEGTLFGGKPTIRLFGATEAGHSVLLHVMDFMHYLYIQAPLDFAESDCEAFRDYLEKLMNRPVPLIHSVRIVARQNLYGYQGSELNAYIKITVTDPRVINQLRTLIEKGNANFERKWGKAESIMTFDNVQYVLRFMIDCNIVGMSWVEAPTEKYYLIPDKDKVSNCQIEAYMSYRDLISHPADGEYAKMAPLRVLSFDIECAGRKGIFPEPNQDPVIQIANVVTRYGEDKPFVRNVFCLGTCSSIVNTQLFVSHTEANMLLDWRNFVEKVDPDVIIGYNTANFDFPYLLDRAKHLKVDRFKFLSRTKRTESVASDSNFSSKQLGNRDTKTTNINGRLQVDMLQLIQRDYHLRSYTLNSVSAEFLNEQKEDVHHTMITELFNGTAESRRRLAVYCLKDAYLPQRLMDKLMSLVNYTEMARVTGVPFNHLLARGQQVRFLSQMFRKALEQKLVIPNLPIQKSEQPYEGATVIEPKKGYYKEPIVTLDFASLYPSIMQAHNLCYTTWLDDPSLIEKLGLVEGKDYIETPNGDKFCTAGRRKGLLTTILEELLTARKNAKKAMAIETDPFKKAVFNGRQLALKVSTNSVYGLTGATVGKLPCLAIARSTTSYGREMIEKTREEVEGHRWEINGIVHEAKVIYGDTDSVMVNFGCKDLATAMELGQQASVLVSKTFVKPIKLEFEKIYYPYLLINKKRYAGLYWTNAEKHDKMDSKGIETVRRDNCRLVQTVIETVLHKILIEKDTDGALEYVKNTISDLLQNKIDMSKLVITKALTKSDYSAKQAHVELAERMKKRDAGSAPTLGDRVAYVIVKGAGSKNYEKSEDPMYVLENNVPIDTRYYLDNQLAKPLGRIFDAIMGDKATQLLNGDHTRSISMAAPASKGLMKFAKKTETCMGCKRPLVGNEEAAGAVCQDCRPRFGELYQKTLNKVSDREVRFSRLWTQCQRCQGSMHCEVICSSKDCPIFYMRMKAKKDVEDASKELYRFDNDVTAW